MSVCRLVTHGNDDGQLCVHDLRHLTERAHTLNMYSKDTLKAVSDDGRLVVTTRQNHVNSASNAPVSVLVWKRVAGGSICGT